MIFFFVGTERQRRAKKRICLNCLVCAGRKKIGKIKDELKLIVNTLGRLEVTVCPARLDAINEV